MSEYQRKNCEQTADGIFQLEKSNRKSKNHKFFDFTTVWRKTVTVAWNALKMVFIGDDRFLDPFYPQLDIRIVKIGQ